MDREDGEMSDDNAMDVDGAKEEASLDVGQECTVLYKAEKNGIFVEKLEKVDASKLEERAKRFGLNLTGNRVITQRQIDELYSNFGIQSGNERHFRFDSINLNGVDGLTTREIFQYLEDYKPLSLEWIDDISCNVVCQDHISAALALLVHSREIRDENIKKMLAEKSDHHWREGMPHPKKDLILIRFATNADKKITKKKTERKYNDDYYDQSMDSISKNPWGDLCKSWGVYDHQEVFQRKPLYSEEDDEEDLKKPIKIKNKTLAMRLGKRRITDDADDNDKIIEKCDDGSDSDSEWKMKSKIPRMRMHADDEESKQKKKQVLQYSKNLDTDDYAPLSIEVENSRRNYTQRTSTKISDKFKINSSQRDKHSIQSRLGEKIIPIREKTYSSDDSSSEHSDSNVVSRVHKVNSTIKSTTNVWSRLDTKPSKSSSVGSDLRQKLKSRKQKAPDNLRDKMQKTTDDLRDKMQKTPDDLRDKMQKTPDDLRDKMQKTPDDLRDKMQKTPDNLWDKMQKTPDDLRDRISKSKQANLRIEIDNNYAQDL